MSRFKIGDVVQLRSGGPKMTVERVPDLENEDEDEAASYKCQWFSGSKLNDGWFAENTLVSPDEKP